ncbi:hypothetical protein DOY81_014488 [Sarcophaga bullata]|nr:hypothetical protein DOY81_014488 [Sarcophaga bullata]
MFLRQITVLIVLNFIFIASAVVHIKVTKLECEHNEKYFYNHTCRLKPINRYKTVAFMQIWIRDVIRNASANVAFYARNSANVYKPYLVNFTSNLCYFMEKKASGIYVNFLMRTVRKYSNINHTCPYRGIVTADNFFVDGTFLEAELIPRNAYKVNLTFYEGYPLDYIGKIIFYADVFDKK